jgi:2,5-diketo-D-gluconate reductase A
MLPVPTRRLNDGIEIPLLGLGTVPMDDADAEVSVGAALDLGYRLLDTASSYGNEVGVGPGIDRSGVDRADVFVTTKLRASEQGYDETYEGLDASLKRLDLDYVDLYLIHWPLPRVNKYVDS